MAIKNVAASIVLGLLFISLVVIYEITPPNGLVTALCVVIMAVSLIIALTGDWRELGVMAIFAGLISLAAAHFLGQARFGGLGGIVIPILWLLALAILFSWISNNKLIVRDDRAILIANTYTGAIQIVPPPLAPPPIPQVQRIAAIIPKYELSRDVRVEKINTQAGHNVDMIEVRVHYKVSEPLKTMSISERNGIPNRGQVENQIAKEIDKDLEAARRDVTFWERLIGRQLDLELEDIVREVIYQHAANAVDAYQRREVMAEETYRRLNELVSRWGVTISMLEFDRVDVDGERFRAMNLDRTLEREAKINRAEAERDATRIKLTLEAEAEAEAERVATMVRMLRDSGVDLSPEDLEKIVISAIRASSEAVLEDEYMRFLMDSSAAAKPAGAKKDNGGKK
jgi:regulator of protease activity HflC (stomatin/prohibitin superfamily)